MFAIIEENFISVAIAWLFFWQMVPAIIVAPFAGVLIDHHGARKTIIIVGPSQMLVLFWLSFSNKIRGLKMGFRPEALLMPGCTYLQNTYVYKHKKPTQLQRLEWMLDTDI